jgi:hypothetical protein
MTATPANRQTTATPEPIETPVPVKDLPAALNHAVTIGGIRADLYNRDRNGLAGSGILVFRGRRILIYPRRYLAWMDARSQTRR